MRKNKVYVFKQNNTAGFFIINDRISPRVYITAKNAKDANIKAESIGIYFDGVKDGSDCICCGDRWTRVSECDVVDTIPASDYDFSWCDYVMFYDENMKSQKIYSPNKVSNNG